jgi:hypothetical protein
LTGQSELANSNGYTIYPNPASSHICIDPNPVGGIVNIYDLEGRLLRAEQNNSDGCLPLSEIATPGIYLLEWTGTKGMVYREKWVKVSDF